MKKRLLRLLLALVMLVGMIPMTSLPAFAATTKVGSINAVGTGYEYSSTLGAYTPVFSTMEAYDTGGNKINISNFVNNSNYAFYTSGSFTAANKLTTEPQDGVTYYFSIYVDLYADDVSYDYDHDSIINNSTVSLPGFEVEYDGLMEREMGSYLQIVYKATKVSAIYVGGVGMNDGDYLAVGATKTQTTKPSGGYAYYKNGKLTLNNYSYEGKGYLYHSESGYYATVFTRYDLTVELVGTNTLTQTDFNSDMIHVYGANLTVGGDGKLTGTSGGYALYADKDITINGGTVEVSTYYGAISSYGDVIINDGDITAETENYTAIYSYYDVTVNGGNVTVISGKRAISCGSSGSFSVAEGMKIQASTTVDGELGEYVAANHDSYKKIVIKPLVVYVGGVAMYDGDYLAVGATKTQTTKPSGGYAYYKNGKLTLNNYSYEGKGYLYNSSKGYYAVIYSKNDLTLELIGSNTLIQTAGLSHTIYVSGASLIVGGTGSLTNTDDGYGFYADQDITINSGTIHSTGHFTGIRSENGSVVINSGDVTAIGNSGIYASVKFVANGGTITATCRPNSSTYAIYTKGSVVFASDMTVQASTTQDGTLGEYVAANHDSYKKITIHSHNFGTAWKYKEADGHAHVCSFCGEHDTVIKHTPDISAPTEKQDQKCTVCGYVIAPSLGHIHKNNLTKVTAKPATCTSDGNSEYYSCSCGKYFKDASASTEIKDKNSVIIKASHSFGTDWGYQDENGHAHACVCGTHDELIPHTPGAEATETTPQKCTECAYIITPALNHVHNLTKISAKPATCTEDGNAEFYICDGCSDWFEDAEGNVKIEDKASVKFVATGHAFGDEFKSDENEHWYECACGEKKDVAAHNDENGDSKCDACGYSSAPAETEPAVTTPSDNTETTAPDKTETTAPDKTDDENKGGMPWWAILLIVVAVAGISVGVTVIVLKKKK